MTGGAYQGTPADSLRVVLDRVFTAPEYEWQSVPNPFQVLRDLLARFQLWLSRLADLHPVAYYALVIALTAVLLGLLSHFAYLIWRALRPLERAAAPPAAPAPEVRDAAWHLREADRLARAGRWADALLHRFLAVVLELDARKLLTFHPSKTPAEYAREARLDASSGAALRDLVGALYRHVFGGAPCGAGDLARFSARATEVTERRATG